MRQQLFEKETKVTQKIRTAAPWATRFVVTPAGVYAFDCEEAAGKHPESTGENTHS